MPISTFTEGTIKRPGGLRMRPLLVGLYHPPLAAKWASNADWRDCVSAVRGSIVMTMENQRPRVWFAVGTHRIAAIGVTYPGTKILVLSFRRVPETVPTQHAYLRPVATILSHGGVLS